MRIRARNLPSLDRHVSDSSPPSPSPSPSSSSSSPSSSSSSLSSITAAQSSLASSQDSSNSFPFSLLDTTTHRCRGLDLLVKAIHQVTAGSVIGVPYIQRRVIIRRRRRRPGFQFDGIVLTGQNKVQQSGEKLNTTTTTTNNNKNKQRKGRNSGRRAIGYPF